MGIAKLLRRAASAVGDAWDSIGRLAARFKYKDTRPLRGFRLARSGRHRDTMLTWHEQKRSPPGAKLWKMHGAHG